MCLFNNNFECTIFEDSLKVNKEGRVVSIEVNIESHKKRLIKHQRVYTGMRAYPISQI